ncbi:hypothetical protein SO802_010876 [Lithocarpus litseifolius]|uniref:Uncharacterized protein n=1 Tax=Lithocarpus litseifolius TaxID=425828 RepID=A0AAW2DGP3_9ROSI
MWPISKDGVYKIEMGKQIVYEECPEEPGKRGKLWLFKDINDVLTENTGTKAIQGIVLKLHEQKEAYWNPESFSKVHDLKLLIIDNVHLLHEPKYLPNGLRFLGWSEYPSKYFPPSFQQKSFDSLKFIKLKKSLKLTETPDFNKIPNLEKLVLEGCINLRSLHPSIGVHQNLTFLNLKGCKNLRSLPSKFEIECLEILIFSGCSNLKRIPEFGENMKSVSKLYLDDTVITKLPTSIENLTGLVLLSVKDCKNLMSLPRTFFNMKWLKELNLSGCLKLLENLVIEKSVEEVGVSGTATGLMPHSNTLFQTLKKLAFGGFKPRSPNRMGLLSTSLSGLCSLTRLNLSYCNLNAIPNDICCLFSLEYLYLNGNNFSCLTESIAELSNLNFLWVNNCTILRSWPKLPLNICGIWGFGCTSLETLPDLSQQKSLSGESLYLSNCSKLAENYQVFMDMFFAMIIKSLRLPLSGSGMCFQYRYEIVFTGSEIPKWFKHQSIGDEVSIQEPYSLLCNEWVGIAVCVAFSSHSNHQILEHCSLACWLTVNGKQINVAPAISDIVPLSDDIWLLYLLPQFYEMYDIKIKSLWECDANEFCQIGVKILTNSWGLRKEFFPINMVKKCGLRMVFKEDIEDLKRTMAERSNNRITHHSFDNSMAAAAEGCNAKRTSPKKD